MPGWKSFAAFLAEARATTDDRERQALVDSLLQKRREWPWLAGSSATFVYLSADSNNVAVNLDTIHADPPFAPMTRLEGTALWYVTCEFARDDLLDYMLAVDDPMTPLSNDPDIAGRVARHWRVDPLNPVRMSTPNMAVSVLRMPGARPFPDWSAMPDVPRGSVYEHVLNSAHLGFQGRKLWIYTPPGYDGSNAEFPLLVMQDGQWALGPMQTPFIADALIKHRHVQPLVIAMMQSGDQQERTREYVNGERHSAFLTDELIPFVRETYRIDAAHLGVGGVAAGAIAAADAALKNPALFSRLFMISPPLGKGRDQEKLRGYRARFAEARLLPKRIFQSVGWYELRGRFYKPAQVLREILEGRYDIAYQFVEVRSGHGLVGFRSVLPEALASTYPGPAWAE